MRLRGPTKSFMVQMAGMGFTVTTWQARFFLVFSSIVSIQQYFLVQKEWYERDTGEEGSEPCFSFVLENKLEQKVGVWSQSF